MVDVGPCKFVLNIMREIALVRVLLSSIKGDLRMLASVAAIFTFVAALTLAKRSATQQ